MPELRDRWIAHITIVILLAGTVWAMITDSEPWPFSNYAMYSRLKNSRVSQYDVYVVGMDDREIRLETHPLFLPRHLERFCLR